MSKLFISLFSFFILLSSVDVYSSNLLARLSRPSDAVQIVDGDTGAVVENLKVNHIQVSSGTGKLSFMGNGFTLTVEFSSSEAAVLFKEQLLQTNSYALIVNKAELREFLPGVRMVTKNWRGETVPDKWLRIPFERVVVVKYGKRSLCQSLLGLLHF